MHERKILGYIDCPSCGTEGGMRVTHDKNGHPFGFCTATCRQQLRVGPDAERVALFVARHPFAAGKPAAAAPAVNAPAAPAPAPAPEPKPAPVARKRSAFADAVALLGGGGA